MATGNQRQLLVIHIKNKLKGRAAQLISSRNPLSYLEIKSLLNAHFGDTRDLSSLIQDLQRLRQLPSESPLTFYNRLQVLNAKIYASIQKSRLSTSEKHAQLALIDEMALSTLLTGLESRLAYVIRASNPKDLLEAQVRIKRELQLSYFENQKTFRSTSLPKPSQPPRSQPHKCQSCGRIGHSSNECRSTQRFSYPSNYNNHVSNSSQNQHLITPNRSNAPQANQFTPRSNFNNLQSRPNFNNSQSRPNFTNSQSRPNYNNYQSRPSFNQNNANSSENRQRAHMVSYDDQTSRYEYDQDNFQDNLDNNQSFEETFDDLAINSNEWQDFPQPTDQNHPPDQSIENPIQSLNIDNMDPNVNFPEQTFL